MLSTIDDTDDPEEILAALAVLSAEHGFQAVGVGVVAGWPRTPRFFRVRRAHERSAAASLDASAGIAQHFAFARRAFEPFLWADVVAAPHLWDVGAEAVRAVGDWLVETGLTDADDGDGLLVPVHGPGSYCGLVMMWGRRPAAPLDRSLALQAMAVHAHWRLLRLHHDLGAHRIRPIDHLGLSAREHQVLCHLADGLTHNQLAKTLGIQERTVLHHVAQARRKLACETRTEAVSLAIRQGLC